MHSAAHSPRHQELAQDHQACCHNCIPTVPDLYILHGLLRYIASHGTTPSHRASLPVKVAQSTTATPSSALPIKTSPPRQPCPILADQDHCATEPRFFACRRHTFDRPCSTLPARPSPLDASQLLTKSRTEPTGPQAAPSTHNSTAAVPDGPPTVQTRPPALRFALPSLPVIPVAGS